MNPDERKIDILHGEPCGCRVLDRVIYVGAPCRVIGHHVTKKRIAQLHWKLWRGDTKKP